MAKRRRVMKKNLTPVGRKGKIDTHEGKGSTEQRTAPGEQETLTGDRSVGGAYPKMPAAAAAAPPSIMGGGLGLEQMLPPTEDIV